MEEIGQIGWYLGEVILHEHVMPEGAVPRDAKPADLLSRPLLLVVVVFKLRRGNHQHQLLIIVDEHVL
jgi:hypothetical protein